MVGVSTDESVGSRAAGVSVGTVGEIVTVILF